MPGKRPESQECYCEIYIFPVLDSAEDYHIQFGRGSLRVVGLIIKFVRIDSEADAADFQLFLRGAYEGCDQSTW